MELKFSIDILSKYTDGLAAPFSNHLLRINILPSKHITELSVHFDEISCHAMLKHVVFLIVITLYARVNIFKHLEMNFQKLLFTEVLLFD